MMSLLAAILLGFALGVRHATDSDHVVAVTTIVSRQRSLRAAAAIGALWGVGHTLTILVVGGTIILFQVVIPPRLGLGLELAVALMLLGLGVTSLSGAMRHVEDAAHAPPPERPGRSAVHPAQLARSLAVGVVHGLAGSAAVALLVLTTIHDPRWALLYLVLFGAGTVVGMMLLTSVIALPFALAAERFTRVNRRLVQLTAVASIGLGLVLAYRIGVTDGLFSSSPRWTPE